MVNPNTHTVPLTYEYDIGVSDGSFLLLNTGRFKLAFRSVCEVDTLNFAATTPKTNVVILITP